MDIVDYANETSSQTTDNGILPLDSKYLKSNQLSRQEFNFCFSLISEIKNQYQPIGWNPTKKKQEMMQDNMRYIITKEGFISFQFCYEGLKYLKKTKNRLFMCMKYMFCQASNSRELVYYLWKPLSV